MFVFYLIALIPIFIGGIFWLKNRKINWGEWLIGSVAALLTALIFHLIALDGRTSDIETVSGRVTKVNYFPQWVEQYEELHVETYACGTDREGNTIYCTRTYYTTEYDTHYEHWTANIDFGTRASEWRISEEAFKTIGKEFGGRIVQGQDQSFSHSGGIRYSGDRRSFYIANETGFIRPVTDTQHFKNKIKATPSVFSFSEIPTNIQVFAWPENGNCWASDRVLGSAKTAVNYYEWDKLNSILGPEKKVNLIIVGFNSDDSQLGHWQQSKWIGGKKNDVVITYGGGHSKPSWAFCFGWTESELVKRNIESYVMENGVDSKIYSFLEKEIRTNYQIKDWTKFDYITIEPRTVHYVWFIIIMVIIQVGLWIWFHLNEFSKSCDELRA